MSVSGKIRVAIAATMVVAGFAAFPHSAFAAGGEQGTLRIHGTGSVYAGSLALVTQVTTAGGSASFAFEVKNTGSSTAQYNFRVFNNFETCGLPCGTPVISVSAGSLLVTKLATGPNGYYTAGIDPGKLASYTLKVTLPTIAMPNDAYEVDVQLYDTAGVYLDTERAATIVKASTGTQADDQFLNGAGQSTVSGTGYGFSAAETTAMAVGGKSTFTAKLANDSTSPATISWQLTEAFGCASYYRVTVKAGVTDVTTLVLDGTYQTPMLAAKASTTLTVTITYLTNATACPGYRGAWDYWKSDTSGAAPNQEAYLVVALAA
jgi:hypothetical protein